MKLKKKNDQLKTLVSELSLKSRVLTKMWDGLVRGSEGQSDTGGRRRWRSSGWRMGRNSPCDVRPAALDVNRKTFSAWVRQCREDGYDALATRRDGIKRQTMKRRRSYNLKLD